MARVYLRERGEQLPQNADRPLVALAELGARRAQVQRRQGLLESHRPRLNQYSCLCSPEPTLAELDKLFSHKIFLMMVEVGIVVNKATQLRNFIIDESE